MKRAFDNKPKLRYALSRKRRKPTPAKPPRWHLVGCEELPPGTHNARVETVTQSGGIVDITLQVEEAT